MFKRSHGESGSADRTGASMWSDETIPLLLQTYDAENIYNADETGLYYRATPNGSLVFKSTALS